MGIELVYHTISILMVFWLISAGGLWYMGVRSKKGVVREKRGNP